MGHLTTPVPFAGPLPFAGAFCSPSPGPEGRKAWPCDVPGMTDAAPQLVAVPNFSIILKYDNSKTLAASDRDMSLG